MSRSVAWCLTYFLNKFLQDWVSSLNPEQLVTELFNGKIELKNLVLNSNLLSFENSPIKLTKGLIQSFQLLIPWVKVLVGEPCLVKIIIDGVFLELDYKLAQNIESLVDLEEIKHKILSEFEEQINQKKKSFYKLLSLMPGQKYFSLEIIEYIISRLQIKVSNVQLSIRQQSCISNFDIDMDKFDKSEEKIETDTSLKDRNKKTRSEKLETSRELFLSIGKFCIIPTDESFEPIIDEQEKWVWNKLGSLRVFGKRLEGRNDQLMSQSAIQFKIISFSDIEVKWALSQERAPKKVANLVEPFNIQIKWSSKNMRLLAKSSEHVDIDLNVEISRIHLAADEEALRTVITFINLISSSKSLLSMYQNATRKDKWIIIKDKIAEKVRQRSWWFLTRKVLWKSVYQKLYAKHHLGVVENPENVQEEQEELNDPVPDQSTNNYNSLSSVSPKELLDRMQSIDKSSLQRLSSRSDEDSVSSGLRQMKNMWRSALEKKPKKTDESSANSISLKKVKSKIIPAIHFNSNCPPDLLEKALMVDLERHLTLDEILMYRQEVLNKLNYEEFKKNVDEEASKSTSFTNIMDYFMKKWGIEIENSTNRIANLEIKLIVESIGFTLERCLTKEDTQRIPFLRFLISRIELNGSIQSSEPRTKAKESEYQSTIFFTLFTGKIELNDIEDEDSWLIKPILKIKKGTSIEFEQKHSQVLINQILNVNEETSISITLPWIDFIIAPQTIYTMKNFAGTLIISKPSKYENTCSFLDFMECFQSTHLKPSASPNIKSRINIKTLNIVFPKEYSEEPTYAIKFEIADINMISIFRKYEFDIKYIEVQTGLLPLFKLKEAQSLFSLMRTKLLQIKIFQEPGIRHIEQLPKLEKMQIKDIYEEPLDISISGGIIDADIKLEHIFETSKIFEAWKRLSSDSYENQNDKTHFLLGYNHSCLDFNLHRSIVVSLQRQQLISAIFNAICIKLYTDSNEFALIIKQPTLSLTSSFFDQYLIFRSKEVTIVEHSKGEPTPTTILHMRTMIPIDSLANGDKLKAYDLFGRQEPGIFVFIKTHDAKSQYFKNIEQEVELGLGQVDVSISLPMINHIMSIVNECSQCISNTPEYSIRAPSNKTSFQHPHILNKLLVNTNNLNLLFYKDGQPYYTVLTKRFLCSIDSYSNKMQVRLSLIDPCLLDISIASSYNPVIIGSATSNTPRIDINFLSYNTLPRHSRIQTLFELRASDIKFTLLNRVLLELINFFYDGIYATLLPDSEPKDEAKGGTEVSLIFLNSTIFMPRNSLSNDGLIARITSLTFGNNESSEFLTSKKFHHELDLDQRNDKTEKTEAVKTPPITGDELLRLSRVNSSGMFQKKIIEGLLSKSREESIKKVLRRTIKFENCFEAPAEPFLVDNFEVYFYDPDPSLVKDFDRETLPRLTNPAEIDAKDEEKEDQEEEKQLQNMLRTRNLPLPLEEINDESVQSIEAEEYGNEDEDEFPLPLAVRSNTLNRHYWPRRDISEDELEEDDKKNAEQEFENQDYILHVLEFDIVDTQNTKITTNTIDFDMALHFSDVKAGLLEISLNFTYQSIVMDLFRDQYNLLMKIFTENFFELPNYPPTPSRENDSENWLEMKIKINELILYIIDGKTEEMFSEKRPFEIYYSTNLLCSLTCQSLDIYFELKNNGQKNITIKIQWIEIDDKRETRILDTDHLYPLVCSLSYIRAHRNESEDGSPTRYDDDLINRPQIETTILLKDKKIISVTISDTATYIILDFLTSVSGFFQCAFNANEFPVPENIKYIHDLDPPGMELKLRIVDWSLIFLTSYESPEDPAVSLKISSMVLDINWDKDCFIGPGSLTFKQVIEFENAYLVKGNDIDPTEARNFKPILEPFTLLVDYMFYKPKYMGKWVTTQVNIRSLKEDNSDWIFHLSFSVIQSFKEISKLFSKPTATPALRILKAKTEPIPETAKLELPDMLKRVSSLAENPDCQPPGEEEKNESLNIALYGACINIMNDQTQSIFRLILKETLGAIQHDIQEEAKVACFFCVLELDYFNQRLMTWEPLIEPWGVEIQLSSTKDSVSVDLKEYSNSLQVNISYSLIESLGYIYPVWNALDDIKERPALGGNPYCFVNQSGLPVKIDIKQVGSSNVVSREIADGQSKDFNSDEFDYSARMIHTKSLRHFFNDRKVIDVDVNPSESNQGNRKKFTLRYKKITNIGIDTPDTHIFLLDYLNENSKGVEIKTKKTNQNRSKLDFFKKFEAFFIEEEDMKKYNEEEIDISACFRCLRPKKQRRNAPKQMESTMDKDYHNIALLVAEILWNQELAQKTIIIRSSITLVNNLPTPLIVSFTRDENLQNPLKEEEVEPMGKLSVPIVAVNKGQMFVRPRGKYEVSRVIGKIASGNTNIDSTEVTIASVIETKNVTLSGLKGIVDENLLCRPVMSFESKEETYLDLKFIPLYCKNQDENLNEHFFCALTVKELPNRTPVRKSPSATNDQPEVKKEDRGIIGYKNKIENQGKRYKPADDILDSLEIKKEIDLRDAIHENELIITSAVSFTNALPMFCMISTWIDNMKLREITVKQGETTHLFYLPFFDSRIKLKVRLPGCDWSRQLWLNLIDVEKEERIPFRISDKNDENSALYLWLRVLKDDYGCFRLTIYSPYWIINKTSLKLQYAEPSLIMGNKISQNIDKEDEQGEIEKNVMSPISRDEDIGDEEIKKAELISVKTQKKVDELKRVRLTKSLKPKEGDLQVKFLDMYTMGGGTQGELMTYQSEGPRNNSERSADFPMQRNPKREGSIMSHFTCNPNAKWKQIELFSTSKQISKLKVAILESETEVISSHWSPNFSLINSGTSGEISIVQYDGSQCDLGVTIEKGTGIFQLTNVITFRPSILLKNLHQREFLVKQLGTAQNDYITLKVNQTIPFFWSNAKLDKILRISADTAASAEMTRKWSGGFRIHELGEYFIRLPTENKLKTHEKDYVQISVVSSDPMIIVQFVNTTQSLPYKFENHTDHDIEYAQIIGMGSVMREKRRTLKKMTDGAPTCEFYTWDEEISPHFVQIYINDVKREYEIDRIATYTINIGKEAWKEALERNIEKIGEIYVKTSRIVKSKRVTAKLADKWLILEGAGKINLEFNCTKLIYHSDRRFEIRSCIKSYLFKGIDANDAMAWYDKIEAAFKAPKQGTQQYIYVQVELKSATHIMKFQNCPDSLINKAEKHDDRCKVGKKNELENQNDEPEVVPALSLQLMIKEIGISLIDSTPQELLYLYLCGLSMRYDTFKDMTTMLEIALSMMKLDNQQEDAPMPVVINPYFPNSKAREQENTFYFQIVKEAVKEIDNVISVFFSLSPLEIQMDEALIIDMLGFINFVKQSFRAGTDSNETIIENAPTITDGGNNLVRCCSYDTSAKIMLEKAEAPLVLDSEKDLLSDKRIFIQKIQINPLEFCVTIDKNHYNRKSKSAAQTNIIQILADLGFALTSIESTELKLAGYYMTNIYQPKSQFFNSMFNHYRSQAIRELYKIVGSVELLGNPAALINSLKAGVTEMLLYPTVALFTSQKQFVPTLLKGGVGFVRHTMHGLFKSFGNLSGGIGKVLTALTLDRNFQNAMRAMKAKKKKNLGDRIGQGFKQISYGFLNGITGIITSPIKGATQGGLQGLLTGIGKGIIGTVTKPAAVIVGTMSDAFSGIGNFAKKKHKLRLQGRIRFPRPFYKDKVLYPYEPINAMGQFAMRKYNKIYQFEQIYFYSEVRYRKIKFFLIVCQIGIFIIKEKDYYGVRLLAKDIVGVPAIDNKYISITSTSKPYSKQERILKECAISYRNLESNPHKIYQIQVNIGGMIGGVEQLIEALMDLKKENASGENYSPRD